LRTRKSLAMLSSVRVRIPYAHELSQERYGLTVGHTNYSAAYCTGLLCARRLLHHFGIDGQFEGTKTFDLDFKQGKAGERRPFKVLLDIGLARTSTGANIFAAMKGAVDGGLNVPHSNKRFPDADDLRKRIYGGHVADYMKLLQKENEPKYRKQFSKFIAAGLNSESINALYTRVHANIRRDPAAVPAAKLRKRTPYADKVQKHTHRQRKAIINYKIAQHKKTLLEEDDDDS